MFFVNLSDSTPENVILIMFNALNIVRDLVKPKSVLVKNYTIQGSDSFHWISIGFFIKNQWFSKLSLSLFTGLNGVIFNKHTFRLRKVSDNVQGVKHDQNNLLECSIRQIFKIRFFKILFFSSCFRIFWYFRNFAEFH